MAADILAEKGISAEVVKINVLCPLDAEAVLASAEKTEVLVVPEEACGAGSIGRQLLAAAEEKGIALRAARCIDLGSGILEHGDPQALRQKMKLDGNGIAQAVMEMLYAKDKTGSAGI